MKINQWVKQLRKRHLLNQHDFAKKIGVAQPYLSRLENERDNVSLSTLERICEVFGEDFETVKKLLNESSEAVTHDQHISLSNEMKEKTELLEAQVDNLQQTNKQLTETNKHLTETNRNLVEINKNLVETNSKLIATSHSGVQQTDEHLLGALVKELRAVLTEQSRVGILEAKQEEILEKLLEIEKKEEGELDESIGKTG